MWVVVHTVCARYSFYSADIYLKYEIGQARKISRTVVEIRTFEPTLLYANAVLVIKKQLVQLGVG